MIDALDDHIHYHVSGKPASPDILWGAFLAMWQRIGKDCVGDYLWFAAKGEHLDNVTHDWGDIPDKLRAEAREYMDKILSSGGKP